MMKKTGMITAQTAMQNFTQRKKRKKISTMN
jgi:hypothetical protein